MRKFRLLSMDKTRSIDISNGNIIAAEPKGLGNKFAMNYLETRNGRRLTNVAPDFEPIQIKLYFNANGQNGYGYYNNLLTFLSSVSLQKFLFEYDDGITKKLCEVVLQNAPKTEKNDDGEFAEVFTFERQSFWFEDLQETFAMKNTAGGYTFPLRFPFRFSGVYFQNSYTAHNKLMLEAPISIHISGKIKNNINIYIDDATTKTRVVEVQFTTNNQDGYEIFIDPAEKKVTRKTPNGIENAYGLLDHNKQSFLYLPQGKYIIGSNIADNDTGKIEISIRRYLFD